MTRQPHTDTQPSTGRSPGQMTVAMGGQKSRAIDRDSVARSANPALAVAHWLIGRRLVQCQQSGQNRVELETSLIEQLADDLSARSGRGSYCQTSQHWPQFDLAYPPNRNREAPPSVSEGSTTLPMCQTLSGESTASPIAERLLVLVDASPLTRAAYETSSPTIAGSLGRRAPS